MTLRLGYLQWLWEDSVKSSLHLEPTQPFLYHMVKIHITRECADHWAPGYAGILSQSDFVHQSQAEQEDSSQKAFCANDLFPSKHFSSEKFLRIFFPPAPQKNGKPQTPLAGKCLTNTSTEL